MFGVDTGILLYAHRSETAEHRESMSLLRDLAEGDELWVVAWPSCYEFVRLATHPKLFSPPSKLKEAIEFIERLSLSPTLRFVGPKDNHLQTFAETLLDGQATSEQALVAQIAAIMVDAGVKEFYTRDNDFRKYRRLRVINPFE